MGHNAQQFAELSAFIEKEAIDTTIDVVKAANAELNRTTPVKTGRLRGGYRVGINEAPQFVPPPDQAPYPAADDVEIEQRLAPMILGDVAVLVDRVPYAGFVDAKQDFFEPAIDKAIATAGD